MSNKDTQFKPGESGNPNGRPPKGYSITEMMQKLLSTKIIDKNGVEVDPREAIGKSILQKALSGDTAAQKLVWSYMDGMPPQTINANVNNSDEKIDALASLIHEFERKPAQ